MKLCIITYVEIFWWRNDGNKKIHNACLKLKKIFTKEALLVWEKTLSKIIHSCSTLFQNKEPSGTKNSSATIRTLSSLTSFHKSTRMHWKKIFPAVCIQHGARVLEKVPEIIFANSESISYHQWDISTLSRLLRILFLFYQTMFIYGISSLS